MNENENKESQQTLFADLLLGTGKESTLKDLANLSRTFSLETRLAVKFYEEMVVRSILSTAQNSYLAQDHLTLMIGTLDSHLITTLTRLFVRYRTDVLNILTKEDK